MSIAKGVNRAFIISANVTGSGLGKTSSETGYGGNKSFHFTLTNFKPARLGIFHISYIDLKTWTGPAANAGTASGTIHFLNAMANIDGRYQYAQYLGESAFVLNPANLVSGTPYRLAKDLTFFYIPFTYWNQTAQPGNLTPDIYSPRISCFANTESITGTGCLLNVTKITVCGDFTALF